MKLQAVSNVVAEAEAEERTYAERAVRDLASVLQPSEAAIFSALAVERMKAINSAPWRMYKGEGLDAMKLASLVNPFLSQSRNPVRMVTGKGAKSAKQGRGYRREDILSALAKLGEGR
jgi:hypothetical protein